MLLTILNSVIFYTLRAPMRMRKRQLVLISKHIIMRVYTKTKGTSRKLDEEETN